MKDPETFQRIFEAYLREHEGLMAVLDPILGQIDELNAHYEARGFTREEAMAEFGVVFSADKTEDMRVAFELSKQFEAVLIDPRDAFASARVHQTFEADPGLETCSVMFGELHFPGMSSQLLAQGYTLVAVGAERLPEGFGR